jgi:dTDP-4-amino-4,6-dideoxygalactose transaminase
MRTVDPALLDEKNNIVIFYPEVPEEAINGVNRVMRSRWIGQGPKVNEFEREFSLLVCPGSYSVAVNSGTSALHLAYLLAGVKPGDEVITPVFTCTASATPLLWIGAKPIFADCNRDNLNVDPESIRSKITDKTKAICVVHYGGLPCDMDRIRKVAGDIPVIEDAAQALGTTYKGKMIGSISEYTCFSFQATKHITTADGGMLVLKDKEKSKIAKRLRWFGINREGKQNGIWENDIWEIGYKYQMTDIAAAMGLAGLKTFDKVLLWRQILLKRYAYMLEDCPGIKLIDGEGNSAWLCTVIVENRKRLIKKLRDNHIESATVHSRNDQYTVFGGKVEGLVNMDFMEDKYLVLPLHTKMAIGDVNKICEIIRSGW